MSRQAALLCLVAMLGMLSCILAIDSKQWDKETIIDANSYSVGEPLEVSADAFGEIDKLLLSEGLESGSLRQKLLSAVDKIEESGQNTKAINDATDILEGLGQLVDWCDLDGYQALLRAYLSASAESGELDAASPTGKLVLEAFEEHGQACRAQYSRKWPQVAREMEPAERVLAGKVDKLFSSDVLDLIFPEDDLRVRVRSTDIVDRFTRGVSRSLFMAKLNESARRTADKVKVDSELGERDATRHLIEPCQSYVENYADIFLPARLDSALNEDKIWQVNPTKNSQFTDSWIRFRVCSALAHLSTEQTLELINKKLAK